MKRLGEGTSAHIVSSVKRSILSSLSVTKRPATRTPISKRLFRSNALPVGIVLGVLLVGLTLAASMLAGGGSVAAFAESISIFKSDCTTPPAPTDFTWGDTVCANVTGAPFPNQRRLAFVAPNGLVAQQTAITSDPQSVTFLLNFAVGDPFRQPGTWSVKTLNNDTEGVVTATFVVHDTVPKADLAIIKSGPSAIGAGSNVTYTVTVFNRGPDDAPDVTVADPPPSGTTFVSATGPSGPCPSSSCTISTLAANSSADFTYVFLVNANLTAGTVISNTASVSSSIPDPRPIDNSYTVETTVVGANTAPCTLNCPGNVIAPTAGCTAVVTYPTPTKSGNCGSDPVVCNPPSGSTFPIGNTTVNCTTQDGGECSFTVTVTGNDTTPPSMTCPSNITTPEDPPGSTQANVSYPTPTATDNCTQDIQVNCNPPSGSSFPTGTTTVTCTATDASNNTRTCTFTVTVVTAACTLTCPENITEPSGSGCSKVVTYLAPGQSGSCGTVSCDPASGSVFPVGTTTVTCTATDSSGNTIATCSFTVTVTGGTLTCPSNIVTNEDPPGGSATVFYEEPASCSGAPVTCTPPSGSSFPVGTTTVTCTSANTGSCSFTVTVQSGSPCVITCPNITKGNDPGQCGAVATFPTKSGNCGSEPISCEPPSGSFFPVGTTSVTCDNDGTLCTFTVTVNDTQAPTITCPANIITTTAPGQCSAVATYTTPTATDNCPGVGAVTCSPASGSTFAKGTTTVTCSATDASNNTGSCSFTVTVNDTENPTVSCPADITKANDPGQCSAVVSFSATASDNCPGATANCNPASGSTFQKGTTPVTCTATDASGNTSTACSFTVTVNDDENPTISCPGNITTTTAPNLCSAVVSFSPTANDNCPGVTSSCSPPSGSTFPKGTTPVLCTATDTSSHTASCSFTVTVIDTQPPAISCPANIVKEPTCPAGAVATFAATASDNCPGVTVVCNPASGSIFDFGTTTVTCTATDTSNNTAPQCSFTVTVLTASATIENLKTSVNSSSLNGSQKQGLISKLDAALDAIARGQKNPACAKLADFINSVQNLIDHGDISAAQGQAWINSAANVRNTLGCTNLGCS